jgi:transcription-repair coupling factor (superfamily II helicase)
MGNGVATAGIEYYLPLFFDDTATVFDYLGADATVVLHGDLEPHFQRFWQDTGTATAWCRATRSAGAAAPKRCSWAPSSSMPVPTTTPNWPCARPGGSHGGDTGRAFPGKLPS